MIWTHWAIDISQTHESSKCHERNVILNVTGQNETSEYHKLNKSFECHELNESSEYHKLTESSQMSRKQRDIWILQTQPIICISRTQRVIWLSRTHGAVVVTWYVYTAFCRGVLRVRVRAMTSAPHCSSAMHASVLPCQRVCVRARTCTCVCEIGRASCRERV